MPSRKSQRKEQRRLLEARYRARRAAEKTSQADAAPADDGRHLNLPYFHAPVREVAFGHDSTRCSWCGTETTECLPIPENRYGCLDCLAQGKFLCWHETEIGRVEAGKLWRFSMEELAYREIDSPPAAVLALSRTPRFRCHQESTFLVHCQDFMRYVGRWRPEDFGSTNDASDARERYVEMAGHPQLWDETMAERAKYGEDWPLFLQTGWAYGSRCYVFQCQQCSAKRCSWDCG